ncbi:hypothetical protein GCM10009557_16560 [Virgisporangium ochraceum]|uniref:Uncharacterized protein n=1 Tax=Virgisporangium ochraceum TaxID=65505 RepID=A0A8J3ZZS9_9ACTN|nr:hypothetical protein Voc01_081160 [Virgisporangium ochraceum]
MAARTVDRRGAGRCRRDGAAEPEGGANIICFLALYRALRSACPGAGRRKTMDITIAKPTVKGIQGIRKGSGPQWTPNRHADYSRAIRPVI